MKKGDIIITPHGPGEIQFIEEYSRIKDKRYCLKLENNPFSFSPVCYFSEDVKTLTRNQENDKQTQLFV